MMQSANQGAQNKVNLGGGYKSVHVQNDQGKLHALVVICHRGPFQLEGGDTTPTSPLPLSPRFFTAALLARCPPLAPDGAVFVRGLGPSRLFVAVPPLPPPPAIIT